MLEECERKAYSLSHHHMIQHKCLLLLDLERSGVSLGGIFGVGGKELSNAVNVPHKSSR